MKKQKLFFVSGMLILLGSFWAFLEFSDKSKTIELKHASANEVATSVEKNTLPKKLHFNLNVNTEYLTMLSNNNQELVAGNNQKFGGDISKSSINLHLEEFNATYVGDNREEYEATTKGVIKSLSGNFNFHGIGILHKVKLSDGEWVYSGSFEGNFKNLKNEETFTLTIRYNPETEESDIVFVSGLLGDTGVLPFGQPFLLEDELTEIHESIGKAVQTESEEL